MFEPIYEYESFRSLFNNIFGYQDEVSNFKNVPANVFDNGKNYMIQLPTPGVAKSDISVDYDNSILTISVKRKVNDEKSGSKYLRRERGNLDLKRRFTLSDETDPSRIEAKMMNGMLLVNIPKKEEAKAKKISIKVEGGE
jgi:HSP20 family protein